MKTAKEVLKTISTFADDLWQEKEDPVVVEAPVDLFLNGHRFTTFFCTPEATDRLAIGYLYTEGLIKNLNEVVLLDCNKLGRVEVELKEESLLQALAKAQGKAFACSPGQAAGENPYNLEDFKPAADSFKVRATKVLSLNKEAQKISRLFQSTGGVHSAALADQNKLLFYYEDIGRYNAVDKLVGQCLLSKISLEDKFIILSGRVASGILLKAARSAVPIIVSRSAPTTLSIELAEKLKITLIGFARAGRLNVYTHRLRLTD